MERTLERIQRLFQRRNHQPPLDSTPIKSLTLSRTSQTMTMTTSTSTTRPPWISKSSKTSRKRSMKRKTERIFSTNQRKTSLNKPPSVTQHRRYVLHRRHQHHRVLRKWGKMKSLVKALNVWGLSFFSFLFSFFLGRAGSNLGILFLG